MLPWSLCPVVLLVLLYDWYRYHLYNNISVNQQFLSLDEEFEDLLHAGDDARVRCSDCGSEYTKRELLDSNAVIIDNAVDALAQDAVKELEKELKKAMKKWEF